MKKQVFYWLALVLVLAQGCKKEESFEVGNTPSQGSLQSDVSGDCLPKTVNGVYVATTPLIPATNTITIQVNVTRTGTYLITTDTVNGYYFRGTGTFTTLGNNNVTLRSNGTPFTDGIDNFIVSYNGTICDIAVEVLPAGSGGPAVFTLVSGGSPVNCASAVVSGTYVKDVALNASHYVDVTVNVTQIGIYTIKATGGGMTFQKTGAAFTATGNQTVRLLGTGTPTTLAANTITFDAPFASCSFTVTVAPQASFTLDGSPLNCTTPTIAGTYTVGTPLTAINTVTLNVTVATAGSYSVVVGPIGGMTFTGNGTLATGAQTILLIGTGTPTTAGANVFPITFGSSNCNFTINVGGPAVAAYTINCAGATPQGTYTVGTALTASNTITIPVTAVTTPGTWSITTVAVNGMIFTGSGSISVPGNIVLIGSGTPTAAASPTSNIVLPAPFASCTIPVTVGAAGGPAVYTINCAGATVQGTYTVGVALTAANTVTIPVTAVTTPGTWSITTVAVNGMTFTGSGSISVPGNIVLVGSGTPTAAASPTSNIVLPAPFASCTIPVTVGAAAVINWSFKIGTTTYSGAQSDITFDNTTQPPITLLDFLGEYLGSADDFEVTMGDISGGINAGETYSSTTIATFPVTKAGYFYFFGAGMELEAADPADTPGANITITITSHNTTTHTVIGTFSGTAWDYTSSSVKTITNGTFTAVYP